MIRCNPAQKSWILGVLITTMLKIGFLRLHQHSVFHKNAIIVRQGSRDPNLGQNISKAKNYISAMNRVRWKSCPRYKDKAEHKTYKKALEQSQFWRSRTHGSQSSLSNYKGPTLGGPWRMQRKLVFSVPGKLTPSFNPVSQFRQLTVSFESPYRIAYKYEQITTSLCLDSTLWHNDKQAKLGISRQCVEHRLCLWVKIETYWKCTMEGIIWGGVAFSRRFIVYCWKRNHQKDKIEYVWVRE